MACPQHDESRGTCPPNLISFTEVDIGFLKGGWNEVSLSRSRKDSTGILRDLNQRLDLERGVVSFFLTRLTQ